MFFEIKCSAHKIHLVSSAERIVFQNVRVALIACSICYRGCRRTMIVNTAVSVNVQMDI